MASVHPSKPLNPWAIPFLPSSSGVTTIRVPLSPYHQQIHLPHHFYHAPPRLLAPTAAPAQIYSYVCSFRYNPSTTTVPSYKTHHSGADNARRHGGSVVEPQLKESSSVFYSASNNGAVVEQRLSPGKSGGGAVKNSLKWERKGERGEIWKPRKVKEALEGSRPTSIAPSTADEFPFPGNITTLMIRNLPNRLTDDLVWLMDKHCEEDNKKAKLTCADTTLSSSSYDFLYLPMDFRTGSNLGYAFVNFTTNEAAVRSHRSFHKFQWSIYRSKKVCEVTPAKIQGLEDLKREFSNSNFVCDTEKFLPVAFDPPRDGISPASSVTIIGRCVGSSSSKSKPTRVTHF